MGYYWSIWWYTYIVSGNSLVPSCKTPLPESILTKTSDAILRDLATMSLAPRLISEYYWVVWQAFLIESDGWLSILWSSILGLSSQCLKLNFSLSHPENLISYLIHYRLTCPGANFIGKAPKSKFYSPGVTGRPLILHTPHMSSYVFLQSINQSNPVLLKERVRIPRTRRAGGAAMLWGRLPLDGVGSCRLFFTDDLHDNLSWVPASSCTKLLI